MRLSRLQRYILERSATRRGGRLPRELFHGFYLSVKTPVSSVEQGNSITKSLERLIDHELLIGYGVRTAHKWYIKEVRLTPAGRRVAKKIRGTQLRLPLSL